MAAKHILTQSRKAAKAQEGQPSSFLPSCLRVKKALLLCGLGFLCGLCVNHLLWVLLMAVAS